MLQYVGSAVATGASGAFSVDLTSLTGGIDTAARAGDLVVVATGWGGITDGNPGVLTSGYTEVAEEYSNDDRDANLAVAWKFMPPTPDASVQVAGSGSAGNAALAIVHVWRGADTSSPMDVAAVSAHAPNFTSFDSPAISPLTEGAVVLTLGLSTAAASSAAVLDPPADYGNLASVAAQGSSISCQGGIASKVWGATSLWGNTVLLLGNDNAADASTTFDDQSDSNHVATVGGETQYDSAQAPTGMSTSILFDGSGNDVLSFAADADFGFGTGAFTVEGMGFISVSDQNHTFFDFGESFADNAPLLEATFNAIGYSVGGSWRTSGTFPIGQHFHWAVARDDSGTTRLFINGVVQGTPWADTTDYGAAKPLRFGLPVNGNAAGAYTGWMSNMRVTKGVARYTGAFTPPALPFDTGAPTSEDPGAWDGATALSDSWAAVTLALRPSSAIVQAIGQVSESDTAQALTRAKARILGQQSTTETAFSFPANKKVRELGQVSETNTARSMVPKSGEILNQPEEQDSAQPIARSKLKLIGLAIEASSAQALTAIVVPVPGQPPPAVPGKSPLGGRSRRARSDAYDDEWRDLDRWRDEAIEAERQARERRVSQAEAEAKAEQREKQKRKRRVRTNVEAFLAKYRSR